MDVGTTQYVDAFQRANFWSIVQNEPGYHVLLGGPTAHPQVLPELTLNVPAGSGHEGSPFGHVVAEVDINYFDTQISTYMAAEQYHQSHQLAHLRDGKHLPHGRWLLHRRLSQRQRCADLC